MLRFREMIKMIKKLALFSLVLFMAGCAGTKTVPLSPDAAPLMQGRSISGAFADEKPGFAAMTADKAMFGALGAVAMISAGNKIIQENSVEDPAARIYESLAPVLAEQYSLQLIDDNSIRTSSVKLDDLAANVNDARLLLDVRTIGWNMVYFPTVWNKYKIGYSAKMRLIDTSTREVLAESVCSKTSTEESDNAPTYDELLADKAALLKAQIVTAADQCIDEFKATTLML